MSMIAVIESKKFGNYRTIYILHVLKFLLFILAYRIHRLKNEPERMRRPNGRLPEVALAWTFEIVVTENATRFKTLARALSGLLLALAQVGPGVARERDGGRQREGRLAPVVLRALDAGLRI